ncbi:MAG: TetR family transcriptional regulator [Polyangiaceae bacterium]|nr:TetR family transcriptional regulator [Polyangiaceae bacterium]
MARWEPNARERLEAAAMELFQTRGYVATTVQDIAAQAGLTERTFFRYYTDKREVLFGRTEELQALIVDAVGKAGPATPPLDSVVGALEAVAPILEGRREHGKARYALIVAHPELRERELIKLTTLAAAVAEALRARRVPEPAASLAAEAGIAIFRIGYDRWIADAKSKTLSPHLRAAHKELKAVVGGQVVSTAARTKSGAASTPKPKGRGRS